MLTASDADRIRATLPNATGRVAERVQQLKTLTGKEMAAGPWSVTTQRPVGFDIDPHDYFSDAPYFWPDPKNPNGPYIRHDGKRNPNRFVRNRNDIGAMSECVLTMGIGSYFLGEDRCAKHGTEVLNTWFLDPKTKMNPHLEHGQAIHGINDGRGTGLIDTVSLIHCVQGILLMDKAGRLDSATATGLRDWFAKFLNWMTTSAKGKAEGHSGNNHATWWTAQVAAYATFTRNQDTLNMAWQHYKDYLVPTEIRPDGSCPREEARTKSLGYTVMNADAFATICRIAQTWGVDLWEYKTPNGISYEKVVRYVEPYVLHPNTWKKEQIAPWENNSTVFLGLAGAGLHAKDLTAAYMSLPRENAPWVLFVDLVLTA